MISSNLEDAIALLKSGKLVAIPTETVYGLAGNALNERAVAEIFQVKNRPRFDPLIVHLPSIDAVEKYVISFPEKLKNIAKKCWPGPLTVLLPQNHLIPDLVTSGSDLCAFRVPNQTSTLALLESIDFPVAAPSANPFGYVSPTSAQHVADQLSDKIPLILDGGTCSVGLESTIIGIENEELVVYRLGGLSVEDLEIIAGEPISNIKTSSSKPAAPGMLESHYAPKKKVILVESWDDCLVDSSIGYLFFGDAPFESINQINLSETKDLLEAASTLFASLRALDQMPIDKIYTQLLPDIGLGRAINDRLKRASA
jgi:L-threonylcarbamoyladenylate synthase